MKQQGIQLRKGLFTGLTLLLIAVFVYLAIQTHRLEKERLRREADVVDTFKPSPVRALQPRDLEITAAFLKSESLSGNGEAAVCGHQIEIRNSGEATYTAIRFKLDYRDAVGKELDPLIREVTRTIPPGTTGLAFEIPQTEIPVGASDFIPSIVYADIEPAEP